MWAAVISSTIHTTSTVSISKVFPLCFSACTERHILIFRGCTFQKASMHATRKVTGIWITLTTFTAPFLPTSAIQKKTSTLPRPPQVALKETVLRPRIVICGCCLSSLTLALTDPWHLYCFYFADWQENYWQRVNKKGKCQRLEGWGISAWQRIEAESRIKPYLWKGMAPRRRCLFAERQTQHCWVKTGEHELWNTLQLS